MLERAREERAALAEAARPVEACIPARYRWAFDEGRGMGVGDKIQQRVRRADAIDHAERYFKLPGTVAITGASGDGKTSIAVWMLGWWWSRTVRAAAAPDPAHWFARAASCRFVTAFDLHDARVFAGMGNGVPALEADAMRADMLVLDDVGLEPRVDATLQVVMGRSDRGRPTLVTTSLAHEAAATRYGEGFARRLFQRAPIRVAP